MATLKRTRTGNYVVRFWTKGRGSQLVYRNLGKLTFEAAKKEAARLEAELRGTAVADRRLTFDELADTFMDLNQHRLSEETVRAYTRGLRYLRAAFGKTRVEDVDPVQVERFRIARTTGERPAKPATYNTEARLLLTILHFGKRKRLIRVCPLDRGDVTFLPTRGRLVYFEPDEWDAFIRTAEAHEALSRTAPLWRFLLLTGSRISEAIDLDWSHVDLVNRQVRIPQRKTRSEKTLTILPDLDAVFRGLPRGFGATPAFQAPEGGRWAATRLRLAFYRIVRRSGIEPAHGPLSPHALRHTAATMMRRRGVPLDRVAEVLGHARSMEHVLIYAHIRTQDLDGALAAIAAEIGERTVNEVAPLVPGRKAGNDVG